MAGRALLQALLLLSPLLCVAYTGHDSPPMGWCAPVPAEPWPWLAQPRLSRHSPRRGALSGPGAVWMTNVLPCRMAWQRFRCQMDCTRDEHGRVNCVSEELFRSVADGAPCLSPHPVLPAAASVTSRVDAASPWQR